MGNGDVLELYCGDRVCRARIVGVSVYDCFEAYLVGEGLERCLPGVQTVEEGVDVYHQYYTEKEEFLYGVVGIQMEVVA